MAKLKLNIEHIYIWTISLSLMFHIFNTFEIGGLKIFYFPSILSSLLAIIIISKQNRYKLLTILISGFIIITFLSAALSKYTGAIGSAVNLLTIILSTYGLFFCDFRKVAKINTLLLPCVLLGLYWCFLYSSLYDKYRFTGFYNDPNYLCTSLIIYIYIVVYNILYCNRKYQIIYIIALLLLLFLVFITLSRTGIICSVLIIIFSLTKLLRRSKLTIPLILISCCIATASIDIDKYETMLNDRIFNNRDNASSATNLRTQLSIQYAKAVINTPEYWLFGLGIGATVAPYESNIFVKIPNIRDHNTITSCFSEQGCIGLILYMVILFMIWKRIISYKTGSFFQKITYLSLILFSISIWQMTYLPFWFALFLISGQLPKQNINNHESMAYYQSWEKWR